MNETIRTHRETALDSPYSRDREDAIEQLAGSFSDASTDGKREILETLREVALDATSTAERELAREQLVDCFEADADVAAGVVVGAFCELARDGKFTDDQLDAIDTLRRVSRDVPAEHVERIQSTLSELATEATRESVRSRARRRLSDVESVVPSDDDETDDYLAASLAEHLENAADDSPGECRRRAEELSEYVTEHPVSDDAYGEVRDELAALVDQLRVAPTGDELDAERRERVGRLADRTKRLYQRSG